MTDPKGRGGPPGPDIGQGDEFCLPPTSQTGSMPRIQREYLLRATDMCTQRLTAIRAIYGDDGMHEAYSPWQKAPGAAVPGSARILEMSRFPLRGSLNPRST